MANLPVLALQADVREEVAKPEEPEVAAAVRQMPVMGVKPTGQVVELAPVMQTPPPASVAGVPSPASVAAAPAPLTENTLPETASYSPLIGLCGLLALVGAYTIRFIRTRVL